jgi:hypothetical protein
LGLLCKKSRVEGFQKGKARHGFPKSLIILLFIKLLARPYLEKFLIISFFVGQDFSSQ